MKVVVQSPSTIEKNGANRGVMGASRNGLVKVIVRDSASDKASDELRKAAPSWAVDHSHEPANVFKLSGERSGAERVR
jgi:hypothetical protein